MDVFLEVRGFSMIGVKSCMKLACLGTTAPWLLYSKDLCCKLQSHPSSLARTVRHGFFVPRGSKQPRCKTTYSLELSSPSFLQNAWGQAALLGPSSPLYLLPCRASLCALEKHLLSRKHCKTLASAWLRPLALSAAGAAPWHHAPDGLNRIHLWKEVSKLLRWTGRESAWDWLIVGEDHLPVLLKIRTCLKTRGSPLKDCLDSSAESLTNKAEKLKTRATIEHPAGSRTRYFPTSSEEELGEPELPSHLSSLVRFVHALCLTPW